MSERLSNSTGLSMRLARSLLGVSFAALMTGAALAQTAAEPAVPALAPVPAAPAAPARPQLGEGVAAVVNGEIVSTYDLKQRIRLLYVTLGLQPTEENLAQLQREALRQLVDERLELQEIRHIQEKDKNFHPEPSAREITAAVAQTAQRLGVTPEQFEKTFILQNGIDPRTLREKISAEIAWSRYIGARFSGNVSIGEDQVTAALARAKAAAEKPSYQYSEIFLDATRVGGQTEAVNGARQLIAQLQQGAPFAAVAQQFSSLPTAVNGGDAGWVQAGSVQPPELEPVLAQLRPGQVSQPIPAAGGVYIVALRDKRAGAGAPVVRLKQAALRVPQTATPAQLAEAQRKLEALRTQIKGCGTLEAEAAKVPDVVAGDLGETEVKDLTPEFQQAIANLQVDQVSAPVRSEAGLHLVALCGRGAAGVKTPSRAEIQSRLENDQFAMIERRFLRDLRNSATIETR
jgi:peptidyl-prolyl cis-trans isomerase SurA